MISYSEDVAKKKVKNKAFSNHSSVFSGEIVLSFQSVKLYKALIECV